MINYNFKYRFIDGVEDRLKDFKLKFSLLVTYENFILHSLSL